MAYEKGLIPYVPADQDPPLTGPDNPDTVGGRMLTQMGFGCQRRVGYPAIHG